MQCRCCGKALYARNTSGFCPNCRQSKGDRNKRIAAAYRSGKTMTVIASEFGLSLSRISLIVKAEGARLTRAEWSARHAAETAERSRRPETREKVRASIIRKIENGWRPGRKAIFANDPERRDDYLSLRDAYGSQYAREVMGLAA